jgi:hypothetical protein
MFERFMTQIGLIPKEWRSYNEGSSVGRNFSWLDENST